jgi:hypothetical protein
MTRRTVVSLLAAMCLLLGVTANALAARQQFTFQTLLTPDREIPTPQEEDAVGHATVMIRPATDEICWVVSWNRIDATVIHSHIHGPVEAVTQTKPPVVTFFMGEQRPTTGIDRGCTVSEAWADAIVADPTAFYVNVHSQLDGPGAIRGQLGWPPSD